MESAQSVGHRLNRKQKDFVLRILNLEIPILLYRDGDLVTTLHIRAADYLRHLIKKLFPILLAGGVRLVGSCAGLVATGKQVRDKAITDIDITILVTEEVDFNQVFYHQQQILRELCKSQEGLLPGMLDTIRVSNELENWSLFSFGQLKPVKRHLDIRVSSKMSRSYVFAHDSFEIIVDPLVVTGMRHESLYAFSRSGDYFECIQALQSKTLVMPEPQQVHHGFLRYAVAKHSGFQLPKEQNAEQLEQLLVSSFFSDIRSIDHVKRLITKTAQRHIPIQEHAKFHSFVGKMLGQRLGELIV